MRYKAKKLFYRFFINQFIIISELLTKFKYKIYFINTY